MLIQGVFSFSTVYIGNIMEQQSKATRRRQKYSVARDKPHAHRQETTPCVVRSILCIHKPQVKFQQALEKFGFLIARYPKSVIFFCILCMILGCLGFVRLRVSNNIAIYPSQSLSKGHLKFLKAFEPNDIREEQIMFIPAAESNILTHKCLQEALIIHTAVTNITGYRNVCFRSRSAGPCMMVNIFEVLGFNSKMLQNFSTVLTRELTGNEPKLLSNGRTLSFLKNKMLSDFKMTHVPKVGNKYSFSARAMKIVYFLKQPHTKSLKASIDLWEEKFTSEMKSYQDKLKCTRVLFLSQGGREGADSKLFNPQTSYLFISIPIIFFVGFISTLLLKSKGAAFLIVIGSLCVGIYMVSSVAISFAVGVSFSNVTIVVLLFLGLRGIVDILLIVYELENLMTTPSVKHRIASCATNVGLITTTTALFDVVVFGFTQLTIFTIIKDAFLVALIGIPLRYLLFFPFLLGCISLLLQKYPSAFNQIICCCVHDRDPNLNDDTQEVNGRFIIFEKYVQLLTKKPSKILVVLLTIGIMTGCAYIHYANDLDYQDNTALMKTSSVANFISTELKYFQYIDVNIIFSNSQIDYENPAVQQSIQNFTKSLSRLKRYSTGNITSWLTELLSWSDANRGVCRMRYFTPCLQKFLALPRNAMYKKDIVFSNTTEGNSKVRYSRVHLFMNTKGSILEGTEQLYSLRKDVKKLNEKTNFVVVPANHRFLLFDMVAAFRSEAFNILIVVGLAILLCPQPLTVSIRIGILLVISFILHVEEVIVLTHIWHIPLNPVSFYCLFIGIMLSLHVNIHILQVRSLATETTAEKRTMAALKSAGPSILIGVLIFIVCSMFLSYVFPFLSTIFLCILPLLFVFALFHSLVLLPVIILISSKPAEKLMKYMAIEDLYQDVKTLSGHYELVEPNTETNGTSFEKQQQQSTICIIGISCRFPQADSKEKFLKMLSNGKCAVSQFPSNRQEEYEIFHDLYHPKRFVKRRICTVGGAFLENIRAFDAEFFNISDQEAPAMDPQQRILLQVVYEAIEDAGLRLEDLQKCKTGVFVGVMNLDYGTRVMQPDNRANMDQFYSTGTTSSIVANRISFCLNLTGPSLSVDTACSSSLTALKIAQCCLLSNQCDVAIVCAPNIVLDASVQMTFSIGGLLAPDGRCKCFDASADGYGRGEGFVSVILKPTVVSKADNDDIYCEIVACGMNNDGQNANPITAPSAKTQTELSKAVLEESGLPATSIEYVEAHGTGTAIGDVVETTSIANTYCDRTAAKQRILRIGSVKSNLNHTESASGLAGLIKVALMIKKGIFLPTVNILSMNPKLKLPEKGMVVQESCEKWTKDDKSCRIAAINSFGYGGSNVHAILRGVQPQFSRLNSKHELDKSKFILTLSAKSDEALRRLAKKCESWLVDQPDEHEFKLNLCYSLTERRSHHKCRLGVVFETVDEAAVSLNNFANNKSDAGVISGVAVSTKQSILFVFGGQGANWEGMGKEMMNCEPLFREHIYEVDRLLRDIGESWSLVDEIMSSDRKRIMGNIIGQPACFAIQYASYKLLESWGVHPSAVVGHSLGELAAACCCGALTVKEALQLILIRSTNHEKCSREGSMAAVGMQKEKVQQIIIDLRLENVVCIAAVNDQNSVTISGNKDSVECMGNHIKSNHPGIFWKILSTSRAFHSTYIDAVKAPCCSEMENIKLEPKLMRMPMYSTVVGDKVSLNQLDRLYWWRNMRQCVLFYQAVTQALKDGYNTMIEISPQPVLKHYLHNIGKHVSTYTSQSIRNLVTFPPKHEHEQHKAFLKNSLCKLYTMGYPIYWSAMYGNGQLIHFPTYPWKEKEYWYRDQSPEKTMRGLKPSALTLRKSHPFLKEVKLAEQFSGVLCWETEIDLHRFPTFKDHVITQVGPVLPGSACVEMAIAMAAERFQLSRSIEVRDVQFTNLLTLPESQVRLLRLRLEMNSNNTEGTFSVCNVQEKGIEMVLAKGSVFADSSSALTSCIYSTRFKETPDKLAMPGVVNDALKENMSNMNEVPLSTFRNLTGKLGFDFGPCYCLVKQIWRKENKAICMLEMDGPFDGEIPLYIIHPAFVDACFQTSVACEDDDESENTRPTAVPIGVKSFKVIDPNIPRTSYCHVTKTTSGEKFTYDMRLVDSFGKVYAIIEQFQSTEIANLIQLPRLDEIAYRTSWVEVSVDVKTVETSDSIILVMVESKGIGCLFVDILSSVCSAKICVVKQPEDVDSVDLVSLLKTAVSHHAGLYSKITIVNFWPVETFFVLPTIKDVDQWQELSCMRLLDVLKFLSDLQSSSKVTCTLVAVSRCAQFVTSMEDEKIPWASSVWGICRTARLEFQNIRTINVDLCTADRCEMQHLTREILLENVDDEVVLRGDKRFANRLIRASPGSQSITDENLKNTEMLSSPVYLAANPNTGKICLRKLTENSYPSEENIEVRVSNFWLPNDISMQLRGTKAFIIGYSGSMTISESSNETSRELVFGMTRTSRLANILYVKKDESMKIPVELSLSQAASLSGCLPFAYCALQQAVNVSSDGCKRAVIIIHEVNRDLGLAGMLIAKALGHSVIGTSSDPHFEDSKRLLQEQGAWLVTDSYLSDLTDQDLSQRPEAAIFFYEPPPNSMRRSCQLLKPGGLIIILGEIHDSRVVLSSNKSISCQLIDYTEILDTPGRYRALWSSCWQLLASTDTMKDILQINQHEASIFDILNSSEPLPEEKTKQLHKPNLSFSSISFKTEQGTSSTFEVMPVGIDQYKLKQDRTYMVVGGVRGFGFEVAKWLAYNGAGTIVLVARSKPSSSKLHEVSLLEKETGAKIKIFQADVSDNEQMIEMNSKELSKLPSMSGIVLTAMVLRDQLIPQVDRETFHQVMAPKVKGAYILHQMSLNMDLDFFVMFSSIASLLGNPGQAAYSAANAFLDGLAGYRQRVLGLPGLSINWGPIKGAGVLQRQENVANLLSRAGYRMLDAKQAIEFMEQFLTKEPLTDGIGLFAADWSRVFESSVGISKSTRFEAIKQESESLQTEKDLSSLGPKIMMESDHMKKKVMVEEFVIDMMSSFSGVPAAEIDLNTSLYTHGLDSFFALTFKMQLESTLEVSFEVFYFMQPDTTPSKIVQDILHKLKSKQPTDQVDAKSPTENKTPDQNDIQENQSKHKELEPGIREYPQDTSCPTATYQLTPLCVPECADIMFFCVHPAGRYVMNLVPISDAFKAQSLVSFYGIGYTDPTMTGDSRSVRQLAQSYVNMIRQLQRHGPYFLGGQSFGGLIAFEMASVLVEQGEDVAFLAMIDTFPWEISNRSAAARLEILFGGTKLEHLMDKLFQATFEQVLSKLAAHTLKMTSQEYEAKRKTLTQDGIIEFLQERAQQLQIALYDIKRLRDSLHQDNELASRKHREWKPGAVYYQGTLTFLKSADQRFTPLKPLQESSDEAWSLLVEGNMDVYMCPGDHLALSEPADAFITGAILATAIGLTYRRRFGLLKYIQRTYMEKKSIQKFVLGVDMFLHSRKGSKPPKYGKLYLEEHEGRLVFTATSEEPEEKKKGPRRRRDKVIDLTDLSNVLPGRHIAKVIKMCSSFQNVGGHRTGNLKQIVAVVTSNHRVYVFEPLNLSDLKSFYQMMEAVSSVAMAHQLGMM